MAAGRQRVAGLLCMALLGLLPGCRSTDDARVLQVLNQRGFGRPTQDANRRYYIGIGDLVVLRDALHKEYNGISERVRMDGTITLSDVGEVYVNGLTPDEATQVIRQRYDAYLTDTTGMILHVTAINSKRYYVTGLPPRRPTSVPFNGDTTLVDAIVRSSFEEVLVDTDKILVIRGDPENPLLISCDYDAITTEGLTRDNILIRENDIIYLTPSIVGYLTYGVTVMLAPLKPFSDLIFGVNRVVVTADTFGDPRGQGFRGNRGFNNF